MLYVSSYNLLADLAISTKVRKILFGLIANGIQLKKSQKSIPITALESNAFLTQQGLYVSTIVHQVIQLSSYLSVNPPLKASVFNLSSLPNEQTFVCIRSQSNSKELLLGNMLEIGELLLTQLTNSSTANDLANWNIWTDDRGYLYFQPTPEALSIWLKMLFTRAMAEQAPGFHLTESHTTTCNNCLYYVELRCNQRQKLANIQINPWLQGELSCTKTAELELIFGLIEVYDSLYVGAKYKIVATGKSLVEKFLEFDRTCRLLDLNPNSPEFHERAGLIAIVRSAVRDLLTHQVIVGETE
jgi:hypothetical protein